MTVIIHPYNNGSDVGYNDIDNLDDMDEFLKFTNAYTEKFTVRSSRIAKNDFSRVSSLKKIWIPKTVLTIEAATPEQSPFYGCSSNVQIFTDVPSISAIPSGWGGYWNYYNDTSQLTVHYKSNKTVYNAFTV